MSKSIGDKNDIKAGTWNGRMTVQALDSKMKELGLSPEKLAELVPVSNMTIRRLLEKPPQTQIPDKHRVYLEPILMKSAASLLEGGDLADMVEQLKADGAKVADASKIKVQFKDKLKSVGTDLKKLGNDLWEHASAKKSKQTAMARSIAIGAILYFINPFDLIPDTLPVVGYLDDFAVMTLALSQINRSAARQQD